MSTTASPDRPQTPTLMLVPGLLCDAWNWAPQSAALGAVAHTQVADLGDADSIGAMAERVLEQAATERFALAGHSMGGRVAIEVWRRAPQRVERLALLDTGYQPLTDGEAGQRERAQRQQLLDLAQREGMRAMGRQWAPGMVHPRRVDTPLFEDILQMIERSTPQRFAAQIRALLGRPDATPLLAQMRLPVLLLCGRDDAWSPLSRHEQMAALIPQSQLVAVDDCGHMSTQEQPEAVNDAIMAWLRRPGA